MMVSHFDAERRIDHIGINGEVITIYSTDGCETPISVAYGTSLQKIHQLIEERCNLYNIWYASVEHIRILFRTAMLHAVKVN
ncbi:hypothetical protein NTE_02538 [Candidatus Nitrososphaera evergladensis SR1]|uniref:Uncharacterized protein n=1 Tax=Candidatus Nitrososphaera evergladensis SR1 TaxID=1459636 RepID=A0A075MTS5_9ARCH|nr:hypothetical protein NTE_02538 [Candidatus Nitrososphaera evergladensis SR1]